MLNARQDFMCCTLPAAQCAGHGAGFVAVGGFAGEEEGVVDRRGELLARAFAADQHVAVSAARKRILVPVLDVCGGEAADFAEDGFDASERGADELALR